MNSSYAHQGMNSAQGNDRSNCGDRHFALACFVASLFLLIPCFAAHAQTAAKVAISARLTVAPDLAARVAKFKRVEMPFHSEGLSAREKQLVTKLVDAAGLLDCIYWRQIGRAHV